ncbi:MAG: DPP IV N-terminal domain-containing protein [Bacteroidales bacterium]|nr:DPP IV N-terminal domain-containing protein [Bacteroidales bacterium]
MKYFYTTMMAVAALFMCLQLSAQDQQLTLKDCVWMNPAIYPQRMVNPQWIPGTDVYTYQENDSLMKVNAADGKARVLLTLDRLNSLMVADGHDSLRSFPSITWKTMEAFYFLRNNSVFLCTPSENSIQRKNNWTDEAENPDLCPVGFSMAYTKGNNLYISKEGNETALTADAEEGISNGSSRVARNEFGIEKGTFWSPNGRYLAFYRMDERCVTPYPLVDISGRIAEVTNTSYPMAGMPSHKVMLGIYDTQTGQLVFAETEKESEQYLTMVSWDPSEKFIYIGILNREQNHLRVNKYDAETGAYIQTLYEERDEQYVEPESPLYFSDKISGKFIVKSYRDGFDHFYLYDTEGKLIQQLTRGEWDDNAILGFDKKGKTLFYTSRKESPLEEHVYALDMKTLLSTRLTPQHGMHTAILSSTGKYFMDMFTSTDVCREYQLLDNEGTIIRTLLENKDPLKNYATGQYGLLTLEANDSTPLYCRLIKPASFDPAKKYPVFFYVYGGPHSQLVSDSWLAGAGLFDLYMAQKGYVVFTMDNRGTNFRGADFEQAIHRNLGTLEVQDQMAGVAYLKTLPFVDSTRMGIDGWSYGGFMTLSMMLKHPGTFKVACAGGPVVDWKWYEIMYGERYMDTPDENPDGYKNASLLNYIDKLAGHALVIHGTMDPVVVWQHSLSLIQKAVEEGVQLDYFVYPGHEHNVRGADRIHLYQKIADYFDLYLK